MARKPIPAQMMKRLFQQSGSACCMCGEADVKTLEIHHITGETERHGEADMLVLCANCHAKAERNEFSLAQVYRAKATPNRRASPSAHGESSTSVSVRGAGNVVAGKDLHVGALNIRTTKTSVRSPVLPGTVAEQPDRFNYLEHLVKRYNEFKEWECKTTGAPMKHSLIRQAYEREIGCRVKDTPLPDFDRACAFLQARIDNTKLGRITRTKGRPRYSGFEAWLSEGDRASEPYPPLKFST